MAPDKAPAFQFYPRDFVGDLDVAALSLEEVGAYTLLLCYAWLKDGLPDDPAKLAKALHVTPAKFQRLWRVIAHKFPKMDDGRLRNERQEEERAKQAAYKQERSESGRKGNAKRWAEAHAVIAQPSLSDENSIANHRSSSASSSASSSSTPDSTEREAASAAPRPSAQALADAWNEDTTPPIARCRELTDRRRKQAMARLRERPLEEWRPIFQRINASDFCRGQNDRGWIATFDWALQPDTAAKVLEGKYDNRTKVVSAADARASNLKREREAWLNRNKGASDDAT
jgi:uncharacterized protein YdaU (DUF1376 family)